MKATVIYKKNKLRRNIAQFVNLIESPIPEDEEFILPANGRFKVELTVSVGALSGAAITINGTEYDSAYFQLKNYLIFDQLYKSAKITVSDQCQLFVDSGLSKWQLIAGAS